MKRVLFLILFLFININNVKASEWQEEFLEGENVLVEYRYKFYKENIVGEYLPLGDNPNYQYENVNDIIYGEYSSYQNECVNGEGYDVEYATKYEYQELLPVQYVKINNLSENVLDIVDIQMITDDNVLVMHEFYSCNDCANDYYSINPSGSLIIKFEYPVKLDEFSLILEFTETAKNSDYSLVYASKGKYYNNDLIALVRGNSNTIKCKYDDSFHLYPNYTSLFTGYDIDASELTKIISKEDVCRSREELSYHYNIIREYYDDNYYVDVSQLTNLSEEEQSEYIKDTEDFKIFYKYDDNINDKLNVNNDIENELVVDDLKLVKTGIIRNKVNYDYLILFILCLLLVGLIIIKYIKMMSNEKNN